MLQQIEARLCSELASLKKSAESARDAATSEESKPENKYDTRGLEASYLAGAQQVRADEIESKLQLLAVTQLRSFNEDERIAATAVVELLEVEQQTTTRVFLLNVGAGYQLMLGENAVMCISTGSPLGQGLIGKTVGEFVAVGQGKNSKEYEIKSSQ